MRKVTATLTAFGLGLALAGPLGGPAGAAPPDRPVDRAGSRPAAHGQPEHVPGAPGEEGHEGHDGHELPNPLEDKRREMREQAITQLIAGEAVVERVNGSEVVRMGSTEGSAPGPLTSRSGGHGPAGRVAPRSQYVELANERTDRVFTLLVEFGDERHPDYPDVDTDPATPGPSTFEGPVHNAIPEPDRRVDNTTVWEPDFSQAYFQELYFGTGRGVESLRTYYERQSSGRYSVDGTVTDWVRVPYNEARYGRSDGYPCAEKVCTNVWDLVDDGMDRWAEDRAAAGLTPDQVAAELATFDVYDRYDHDGDGDFNEPDGYVDHLQIVHAGGDQADGDPYQGEDAIWSHRWYAYASDAGLTGPADNLLGGVEAGDTGIWVGDYTIQPENGGLSTIAHEYGHDLGLPDHYDTTGGQNGVEWWTLMAQSRLAGEGEAIGTRAGDMSAWDKLQLGWLDYEVVPAGQTRTLELGPHEFNSDLPQGLVVVLPPKEVTTDHGSPAAGTAMWWSGKGDDLANTLTRHLDLSGASSAQLDLVARYEIESGYDDLYVQVSADGGATWESLDGTAGGEPFDRDGSDRPALSRSTEGAWVDVTVPLDAYAGQAVDLRFLYRTDGGLALEGFFADEIVVRADGVPVVTSGAETGDEGWALDGFVATTGIETAQFPHHYLASHRTPVSYDRYLATGPYNFGFPDRPDWVEHFAYEPGLLVSYWDTSQLDNNTSQHPGEGLVLPVDAHPRPIYNLAGAPWRSRIQVYDAPFSLTRPRSFTLHVDGIASYLRGGAAEPRFDDTRPHWFAEVPEMGVKLPATGTTIEVLSVTGTRTVVQVSTT
ncbi:MAG: immune inhibitor A domain-containing protein [Acidimicrobiia bacterium]